MKSSAICGSAETDGRKILSASVQGLDGEEWKDRNVYQSGYFLVDGDVLGEYSLSDYRLWDYGFDYYAPQSFETEDGRRIQIGWMGMPDCEEYTNLTVAEGWQHCFTFPREVFVRDGAVCQRPVRELEEKKRPADRAQGRLERTGDQVFEADITEIQNNSFRAVLGEELILEYRSGRFEMRFSCRAKDSVQVQGNEGTAGCEDPGRCVVCGSVPERRRGGFLDPVLSEELFPLRGRRGSGYQVL